MARRPVCGSCVALESLLLIVLSFKDASYAPKHAGLNIPSCARGLEKSFGPFSSSKLMKSPSVFQESEFLLTYRTVAPR